MKNWQYLLEEIPSNSLLVSTPTQKVLRFYCPISAICSTPIAGYKRGEPVSVKGIYPDSNHQMLYLIDGLKLPYNHFYINIK